MVVLNTAEERLGKLEDSFQNITQIAGQKETQMENINDRLIKVEGGGENTTCF